MKKPIGFACAIILSGCSDFRSAPAAATTTSLGSKTTYLYGDKNKDQNDFYQKKYDGASDNQKKIVRNQIIDELMGLVDDEFEKFSRELRTDQATKNFFVQLASLSLTGAAPFSSSSAAKALAGIDTGLKGASDSFDLQAWGNESPQVLINSMRAERALVAEPRLSS